MDSLDRARGSEIRKRDLLRPGRADAAPGILCCLTCLACVAWPGQAPVLGAGNKAKSGDKRRSKGQVFGERKMGIRKVMGKVGAGGTSLVL